MTSKTASAQDAPGRERVPVSDKLSVATFEERGTQFRVWPTKFSGDPSIDKPWRYERPVTASWRYDDREQVLSVDLDLSASPDAQMDIVAKVRAHYGGREDLSWITEHNLQPIDFTAISVKVDGVDVGSVGSGRLPNRYTCVKQLTGETFQALRERLESPVLREAVTITVEVTTEEAEIEVSQNRARTVVFALQDALISLVGPSGRDATGTLILTRAAKERLLSRVGQYVTLYREGDASIEGNLDDLFLQLLPQVQLGQVQGPFALAYLDLDGQLKVNQLSEMKPDRLEVLTTREENYEAFKEHARQLRESFHEIATRTNDLREFASEVKKASASDTSIQASVDVFLAFGAHASVNLSERDSSETWTEEKVASFRALHELAKSRDESEISREVERRRLWEGRNFRLEHKPASLDFYRAESMSHSGNLEVTDARVRVVARVPAQKSYLYQNGASVVDRPSHSLRLHSDFHVTAGAKGVETNRTQASVTIWPLRTAWLPPGRFRVSLAGAVNPRGQVNRGDLLMHCEFSSGEVALLGHLNLHLSTEHDTQFSNIAEFVIPAGTFGRIYVDGRVEPAPRTGDGFALPKGKTYLQIDRLE